MVHSIVPTMVHAVFLTTMVTAIASGEQPPYSPRSAAFSNVGADITRYVVAAILEDEAQGAELEVVQGTVAKRPDGPVFTMDKPWETDVNNGYSSVLYDKDNTHGLGVYRAYYSASDGGFGTPDCPKDECGSGSATLLANSSDGLTWGKPTLGLFAWNGSGTHAGQHSDSTNIVFEDTTAVAIFDDAGHDKNVASRFKAWGNLAAHMINPEAGGPPLALRHPAHMPWKAPQVAGLAVSADGLHWTNYKQLQDTTDPDRNSWRFDAQASMFYDEARRRYVGTDRAFRPCDNCGLCPIWWQPSGGCQHHHSTTCTAAECNRTVRAVGVVTSTTDEFSSTDWSKNVQVFSTVSEPGLPPDPSTQFYSQVTWPFYNVFLGIVMVFDAVDPPNVYNKGKVHCELAMSTDPEMAPGTWRRLQPGTDFIPLGEPLGPGRGSFDSHICFASGVPLRMDEEVRIFYMGGDGPHYSPSFPSPLHRNSSFGLATLRQDGFVAVRTRAGAASGSAKSVPVVATGSQLVVTADTAEAGSVTISVDGVKCDSLTGSNVTDHALQGCGNIQVGKSVVLEIQLNGPALLYTVGFTEPSQPVTSNS